MDLRERAARRMPEVSLLASRAMDLVAEASVIRA